LTYSKKDSLLRLQDEIIYEYQKAQAFLNRVFMGVVRTYKDKPDRTEVETAIMNFAWESNDCLVDNSKLSKLLKRYNEETKF
jgi:hypothetical protein